MKRSEKMLQVIFVVAICMALLYRLGTMELRDEEPHRAVIAKEMILGKEWIVPKYLGWNYYHKPPLFNWLLAFSFLITGSTGEVAVRLPSIVALLLTALFVYIFSKNICLKNICTGCFFLAGIGRHTVLWKYKCR